MNKNKTYVLFGAEAISTYRLSLTQLLMTPDVEYTINEFSEKDISKFIKQKEKWCDFIEIPSEHYEKIKKHFKKNGLINGLPVINANKEFWKKIYEKIIG